MNIVEKKPIAIFYDENHEYFFLDENGNKIEEVNDINLALDCYIDIVDNYKEAAEYQISLKNKARLEGKI